MKITFLGTSHGFSEKGRFMSSILLDIEGKLYIIDAGAPIDKLLIEMDLSYDDIEAIFITHFHNDHVASLSPITEAFTRFRPNNHCTCLMPEEKGFLAYLNWMDALYVSKEALQKTINFKIIEPGVCYEDSAVKVTAIPTKHLGDKPFAFGFEFTVGDKKILFTGDMSKDFPEYAQMIEGKKFDLVVSEITHCRLYNVSEMFKNTDTKQMVLTHVRDVALGENYLEEFKKYNFSVKVAYDGMEIEL